MSTVEDRVRAAFREDAETVDPESIPPVPRPGAQHGRRQPAGRRKSARWVAPAAAVIAVLGVIAVASLVARPQRQSSIAAPAGMPPYYVTLTGAVARQHPVLTAAVRDSATGALLTTVDVPVQTGATQALPGPSGITAAADGQTFVITDDLGLFLLRVAAGGRSARLARLPIHVSYIHADAAALSPDGKQLAIDVEVCPEGGCREGIEVVSLANGASRLWTGPSVAGAPLSPAWVDDGSEIMFLWQAGGATSTAPGYRLLNVSGPGGALLGSSQPMVSPPTRNDWSFPAAMLTPDGRGVITTDYRNIAGRGGGTAVLRVVELSASAGRLLRVLHVATEHYGGGSLAAETADARCQVLSLGPSGMRALIQCPGFGRLNGDRFTALPGVPAGMGPATGIGGTAAW